MSEMHYTITRIYKRDTPTGWRTEEMTALLVTWLSAAPRFRLVSMRSVVFQTIGNADGIAIHTAPPFIPRPYPKLDFKTDGLQVRFIG